MSNFNHYFLKRQKEIFFISEKEEILKRNIHANVFSLLAYFSFSSLALILKWKLIYEHYNTMEFFMIA